MLDTCLRQCLLDVAWQSIHYGLERSEPPLLKPDDYPEILREHRASFVTLTKEKRLRGCIGTLEAIRPLVEDTAHNAYAAAFQDPRFSPLTRGELDKLDLKISILSLSTPIAFTSEEDLLRQLRPGIDGLIIQQGDHRATFLPAVWDSLPNPTDYLRDLKRKAGITTNDEPLKAWRYTTEFF
ncbi:MAG: AmmeMemoRadiSam system protein A [Gammaproteobacteria bacterium]|nr:AmmeMemoRadiSam system protein A [Gammaproteobacteria bacterium]